MSFCKEAGVCYTLASPLRICCITSIRDNSRGYNYHDFGAQDLRSPLVPTFCYCSKKRYWVKSPELAFFTPNN